MFTPSPLHLEAAMMHALPRRLGYLTLALSALAVLPLTGAVSAKGPGRLGFTPYQPNGQMRPNQGNVIPNGGAGFNGNGGGQGISGQGISGQGIGGQGISGQGFNGQ